MMIGEGKTFAHTLDEAATLARHVEAHGYKRYWIAEHHDLPGIASSATTLLIQHLAAATSTLRVASGGIMLPNHSPLIVNTG
jgi:alkanesulfonate monooxygenase SsuD/methylene tetrahydromethanopterin reductase-like flavin-dependent oxidoreductase (luciferase family)